MKQNNIFRFAFKMIPRRQEGSDAGILLTYVEEHSDEAEGAETKVGLECRFPI